MIFSPMLLCILPLMEARSFRDQASTGDIIQRIRDMTDTTISSLREVAQSPTTSAYINRIILNKNNVCLGSLEEAIEGIENTTALLENAGDEVRALIDQAERFSTVHGPSNAVREVASLLRLLGPLIKKITPQTTCQGSPDQAAQSIQALSEILIEISELQNPAINPDGGNSLRKAATALNSVNNFFTYLRVTFEGFDQMCSGDKEYNIEAIQAIGDMISHLADLAIENGAYQLGLEIKRGKLFAYKLAIELKKVDFQDLGTLDCSRPGDFSLAADTMDEIAVLVDEIGLESLQQQLGVDFSGLLNFKQEPVQLPQAERKFNGAYPVQNGFYPVQSRVYPVHYGANAVHYRAYPAHHGANAVHHGAYPVHRPAFLRTSYFNH